MQKKASVNLRNAAVAAILVLCFMSSMLFPVYAEQTSGDCGEGLTWCFDSEAAKLTVEGNGEIPGYYSNEPGSEGAAPWSAIRNQVKTLVLSGGITSIGQNAFYGMENLTAITVPNSVTSIGAYAFSNCIRVRELILGENVEEMDKYAFAYLKSLRTLRYQAVSASTDLTKMKLEDGKVYTFSSVFYAAGVAEKGVEVIFGNNVVTVPPYLFGRRELSSPESELSKAFKNASKLLQFYEKLPMFHGSEPYPLNKITSVKFGSAVAYIDECAFAYCDTIKDITFNEAIQFIGSDAFSCGSAKTKLHFPTSSCYAAKTVTDCKNLPPVKAVTSSTSILTFEPIHLVDKNAPPLEQLTVLPLEMTIDVGMLFGKVFIWGILGGIGIGITETMLMVLLPFLPELWVAQNIEAMSDYYTGYYQHTHV